jgi:hypothetical protein
MNLGEHKYRSLTESLSALYTSLCERPSPVISMLFTGSAKARSLYRIPVSVRICSHIILATVFFPLLAAPVIPIIDIFFIPQLSAFDY